MKKLLAMFLALTLVFSMPGAVFAENETESTVSEQTNDAMETTELEQSTAAVDSTVLNLAGDAVEEVVNLKNGQSVTTDNDVAVRLNVQEDPEETEYTVTMDGESVEEDHSTSQYHFYYLPSEQMNGAETNVSVSTQAAEEISTQALTQGTGTAADPYRIATADDLKAFRDKVNRGSTSACAVLTSDITLNKSEKWTPIGTSSNKYAGTFDGDGHTISGINVDASSDAGLFGTSDKINTPHIKNLAIADSSFVTSRGDLGAFLGWGSAYFENCHTAKGVTVHTKSGNVGGIVGYYDSQYVADMLTMQQCSNEATVTSDSAYAGGLIGKVGKKLTLNKSFNAGAVTGVSAVGGIIGQSENVTTMENVYNVGVISASNANIAGGIIGRVWANSAITIKNAYQHGSVTANNTDGAAIVGTTSNAVTLTNVYKTGSLSDKADGNGTVTGSASVKSEEELKALAPTLGGEFASDLAGDAAVNSGFPVLKWQNPTAAAADTLQIKVKDESGSVVLDDKGSIDPANPTEKTVAFESGALNTFTADRIYLNVGAENAGTVELGMELSAGGTLSKKLTAKKDGYTADELYFYRLPGVVGRTVYAVHIQDGTARYYKLQIQRKADESMSRYGALNAEWRDDNPVLKTTYEESTGYLIAKVNVSDNFAFYNKGVLDENRKAQALFTYDKPFKYYGYNVSDKEKNGFQTIQFARVGRWWATNASDTLNRSSIPIAAWWGSKDVADKYLAAAAALKTKDGYNNLPEDLRTAFDSSVKTVSDGWKDNTAAKPLYLDGSGNYTTTVTDFVARDACGAPMTGEYKLEYQENLMLDYMDVIKTYLTNSDLGSWKYQALKNLTAGIDTQKDKLKVVTAMAVTDDTTKSAYEYYYQRAWRIVNASDITEINSALTDLGLDRVKIAVVSEKAQVLVGNKAYNVDLTEGGISSSSAKTVTVTAERGDGGMQRIYFAPTENTTFIDSDMEAVAGKGYTKDGLFFYDTPVAQSKSFTIAVKQDGTNRYYTIQVQIPAKSGLALGTNGMGYEEQSPGTVDSYDGNIGYVSANIGFDGPYCYAGMSLYKDGVKKANSSVAPAWSSLASETQELYYQSQPQAYFARFGTYWLPVSTTENGTKVDGLLPMRVKCAKTETEKTIYSKAAAVKDTGAASEEAKKMLTDAMQKVNDSRNHLTDKLYLKSDGSNPDNLDKATGIQARSYFGAYLYGDSLIEKELNTVLDLTDIFTTWGTDAKLAAQQFEAYQKIMNMDGGVHAAIEIQSVADQDLYQKIRQAKWNIVKATDLKGINTALTSLDLPAIGDDEPKIIYGDVDNDSKIDIKDISLMIRYWNKAVEFTDTQMKVADLDGDGLVDIKDISLMIRYWNKAITSFPVEKKS